MKKRSWLFIFFLISAALFSFYHFSALPKNAPKMLSPWISGGMLAANLWLPDAFASSSAQEPEITADSAYFVDANTGQVLYEKNPHLKRPIASLTKVMTAIVTLENHGWNDQILVSKDAANMEPDHMLLQSGEKLTVEELLYGIFLVSANDAAEALAENTAGGRENFISEMNKTANLLGMYDTHFINPTGLQEDGKDQFSSAYDVALMARYLVSQFPHVIDISSTYHKILPQTPTHQDYDMYSGINLLTTYPGVKGLKIGYTPEAGLTIVSLAERDNHWVIGVLLNSEDRRDEARKLLDYSFKKLGVEIKD